MTELATPPSANRLQQAWLRELGVDARLLSVLLRAGADGGPAAQAAAPGAASAEAPAAQALAAGRTAAGVEAQAPAPHSAQNPDRSLAQSPDGSPDRSSDRSSDRSAAQGRAPAMPPETRAASPSGRSGKSGAGAALAVLQRGKTPRPAPAAAGLARPGLARPDPAGGMTSAASPLGVEAPGEGDWPAFERLVADCRGCGLAGERGRAVFGVGEVQTPDWLLVGEAPGDEDDRQGLPFQGRQGALLRAMLQAAGISLETGVYLTNLVKCRPLGNRPPSADEIEACRAHLLRQIEWLRPRRIVAMGEVAAQALLDSRESLEALRGRVHQLPLADGSARPLLVTHHPGGLLLRPHFKAQVWRDLLMARAADID